MFVNYSVEISWGRGLKPGKLEKEHAGKKKNRNSRGNIQTTK
jgi:hypothetical protein